MENQNLKDMVNKDIQRCIESAEDYSKNLNLLYELHGRYSKVSTNYPDLKLNPLMLKTQREVISEYIYCIKGFLETYLMNGCKDYHFDNNVDKGTVINISNNNNIHIESIVDIKNKIQNTPSLKSDDKIDIMNKIDEIDKIIKSTQTKEEKWDKTKEIVKWIADKGIDTFIQLIPLILQIYR